METLRQDIAYALRQLGRSPVFTLTALLTLAPGIGATTAIFSLIHTVMLKSLPVADPSSLYRIGDGQDCCVEGKVVALVLRGAFLLIGLLLGVPVAIACWRLIAAQLYQLKGWDPMVLRRSHPCIRSMRIAGQHHSRPQGRVDQSRAGPAHGMIGPIWLSSVSCRHFVYSSPAEMRPPRGVHNLHGVTRCSHVFRSSRR